jgi:hypothetical protein
MTSAVTPSTTISTQEAGLNSDQHKLHRRISLIKKHFGAEQLIVGIGRISFRDMLATANHARCKIFIYMAHF